MARYPKPAGWNGGPDGSIQRQGSAGRIGPCSDTNDDHGPAYPRNNVLDFDESDFGGPSAGQCDYDGDEGY